MAIEARVQYALDNFRSSEYFDSQKEWYELLETDEQGRARIILNVGTTDNICVRNYDRIPHWAILRREGKIPMGNSIDHFILRKVDDVWELHMIEIKKTASPNNWQKVKLQMSVSYLKIEALLTFLGISIHGENVVMYTAYGEDKMSVNNSQNSGVTTKTFKTGERFINSKIDEWDSGAIYISIIDFDGIVKLKKFRHIKIKLNLTADKVLEQNFTLP